MAWQIVTKTVNGNKYHYGKPTSKSTSDPGTEVYLGTADDIVAIVQAFHQPLGQGKDTDITLCDTGVGAQGKSFEGFSIMLSQWAEEIGADHLVGYVVQL